MKKEQKIKSKKSYSLDERANAKKYYLIGLSLQEASKLIDAPLRTVEKWYVAENWKTQREASPIRAKAYDLFESGKSYLQIAKMLGKSKSTIYRYLTSQRNESNN